jgi:ribosomal-protein-alanine N-acetyltransferase
VTLLIEPATAGDLDAICELERHSFPAPWPRSTFEAELVAPHARLVVGRERGGGPVVGFCNFWLVTDEVHILAIATHPDRRRAGLGTQLLTGILTAAALDGSRLATLEVRAGNRPAIALYAATGFVTVHTRRAYYQDNHEDGLVMTCDLSRFAAVP